MEAVAENLWHLDLEADTMCPKPPNLPLGSSPTSSRGMWGWGLGAGVGRGKPHRESHGFGAGVSPPRPGEPRLHTGSSHQPGTTAWDSVLPWLVFAIRKFSGPSSALKLVPMKTKSFHLQRRA